MYAYTLPFVKEKNKMFNIWDQTQIDSSVASGPSAVTH